MPMPIISCGPVRRPLCRFTGVWNGLFGAPRTNAPTATRVIVISSDVVGRVAFSTTVRIARMPPPITEPKTAKVEFLELNACFAATLAAPSDTPAAVAAPNIPPMLLRAPREELDCRMALRATDDIIAAPIATFPATSGPRPTMDTVPRPAPSSPADRNATQRTDCSIKYTSASDPSSASPAPKPTENPIIPTKTE
ncbi:hypothetical protein E3U43_017581 [Larimichthys crocea]|uniref:Uncharacterized protein n=1 Tax=Larimichthys crocea TaxID=215358 RepID=A0ACD3R1N1_LARCR|nr:hypothetical protein E3U43_017581 [Larimichthys crocea]